MNMYQIYRWDEIGPNVQPLEALDHRTWLHTQPVQSVDDDFLVIGLFCILALVACARHGMYTECVHCVPRKCYAHGLCPEHTIVFVKHNENVSSAAVVDVDQLAGTASSVRSSHTHFAS
jgi:hypothetical protein